MAQYIDKPYNLTDKQLEICNKALDNGFENISKREARVLATQASTDYLDAQRTSLEQGHPLTYMAKLNFCYDALKVCFSSSILNQISSPDSSDDRISALAVLKTGREFIETTNKMQGHEAPTKNINVNADFDSTALENAINSLRELNATDKV